MSLHLPAVTLRINFKSIVKNRIFLNVAEVLIINQKYFTR